VAKSDSWSSALDPATISFNKLGFGATGESWGETRGYSYTVGAEKLGNDPSQQLARGLEAWRKMSEDAWKPEAQAGEPTVIGTINLEKRF
jgi:hypothetical protein